ncbi:hypothetical protein GCM10009624_34440 [Gordonia sinesedis]
MTGDTAGDSVVAAWARYAAGEAALDTDPDLARQLLDHAVDAARHHDDRYLLGVAMVSRASIEARHGSPHAAATRLADVVEYWRDAGNWTNQWVSLRTVAAALADLGDDRAAALVLGAVRHRGPGRPAPAPGDEQRLARLEQVLRHRLGDNAVGVAMASGAAMTPAAIVELAVAGLRSTPESPGATHPADQAAERSS